METILFFKGIHPISGLSISCHHLLWIVTVFFPKLSELKLKQLHTYLWALQPYHDFHDFWKMRSIVLDIPSRRPRLDKYSQKSTLYQLLDCAKFCSWSFFAIICSSYIRNGPARKVNWLTILLEVCLVLLPATAVKTKNDATANKHNRARETLHAVLIVSVF